MSSDPNTNGDEEIRNLMKIKEELLQKKRLRDEIRELQKEIKEGDKRGNEDMMIRHMERTTKISVYPHLTKFDDSEAIIDEFIKAYDGNGEMYMQELNKRYKAKLKNGTLSPHDVLVLQYLFAEESQKCFLINLILTHRDRSARILAHNTFVLKEADVPLEGYKGKIASTLEVPLTGDEAFNEKLFDIGA